MRERQNTFLAIATLLAMAAAPRPAPADALRLTGDAEIDFPATPNSGVVVIVDNPGSDGQSRPGDVGQVSSLPGITGWNIKDLRLAYDGQADTMYFGLNFFGIAGDADGDGNPGSATYGVDLPDLGGLETITVVLDVNLDGMADVVAGVPAIKPETGKGTDFFTVSSYKTSPMGLGFSYGDPLVGNEGQLVYSPSAEHPDFIFTISNFKKLPGLDPEEGFIVGAFAGTSADIIAGEDYLLRTRVTFPSPQEPQIPEPATLIAWGVVVGATAAWRLRRRHSR